MIEQVKYYGKYVFGGLWFFLALFSAGPIFRQEVSPWFWEQYLISVKKHGTFDGILTVLSYFAFYASGYIFPYFLAKHLICSKYYDDKRLDLIYSKDIKGLLFIISFGCFIFLISMLKPTIYTINYITSSSLLLFSFGIAVFVIIFGVKALIKKLNIFKFRQYEDEK